MKTLANHAVDTTLSNIALNVKVCAGPGPGRGPYSAAREALMTIGTPRAVGLVPPPPSAQVLLIDHQAEAQAA